MSSDPAEAIRETASAFPDVDKGTSCNQSSFKARGKAYLYIGPGAKGIGFKAMFKLNDSMPEAEALAADSPHRLEVGSTGWVTARFSAEGPLPESIWTRWLQESYDVSVQRK
jgi:hypothetical protein